MAASTSEKTSQVRAKSGYLGGIFGRFGALRGTPGVTDGRCAPQEGEGVGGVRKTQYLMIFWGLYPSFPMKKTAEANLVISVVFLVALEL